MHGPDTRNPRLNIFPSAFTMKSALLWHNQRASWRLLRCQRGFREIWMSMRRLSQMKQRLPSAEAHYLGFFGATALNLTWTGLDMRGRPRLPTFELHVCYPPSLTPAVHSQDVLSPLQCCEMIEVF